MIDMSPEAVEARLRETSRLAVLIPPFPPAVDMSPGAMALRLREVAQLWALERKLRVFQTG